MESLFTKIDPANIPHHVAIIMDGNGRWAKSKGLQRSSGHIQGVEAVRTALKAAQKAGVKVLTLYTFSEENWNRPQEEVKALMELLVKTIGSETEELKSENVRLHILGDMTTMPDRPEEALRSISEATEDNSGTHLVLAINYSGRSELIHALNSLSTSEPDKAGLYTEEDLRQHLGLPGLPDPDLLIRTGGECRVSNFLLWQIAYTELYFVDTYWPDFGEEDFYSAIIDYQRRQRRYGKTGEQVNDEVKHQNDADRHLDK